MVCLTGVFSLFAFVLPAAAAISEAQLDGVIAELEKIYAPVAREAGRELRIESYWEDLYHEGANVNTGGSTNFFWAIYIKGGGYAKYPMTDMDSTALLICHELGHHMGGHPKAQNDVIAPWQLERGMAPWEPRSSEGQADYFATSECLRRYFENENNEAAITKMDVPDIVRTRCRDVFFAEEDSFICQRSSMAALNYIETLRHKRSQGGRLSAGVGFATPETVAAGATNFNQYPGLQCRLDTFFSGALGEPRPACWFRTEH